MSQNFDWNDFEVMRSDPTSHMQTAKYLHYDDGGIFENLYWEGQPGYLDENGNHYETNMFTWYEERSEGNVRVSDENFKHCADETNLEAARGRRDDSTTGVFNSWKHRFSLTDPLWQDVTNAASGAN